MLSDSALPVGGFIASGGLEAAVQMGVVSSVEEFLQESLHNLSYSTLPFVNSAYNSMHKGSIPELLVIDESYNLFVGSNHVAKRASCAQGVAYLTLVTNSFPFVSSLDLVQQYKLKIRASIAPGHLCLCFAMTCFALGLSLGDL